MSIKRSIIRKITIGEDPKDNGIAFQVGNKAGGGDWIISSIEEDVNHYFEYGVIRYTVLIKSSYIKNDREYIWKSFQGVPVTIEYYLPDSNGEYKVLI